MLRTAMRFAVLVAPFGLLPLAAFAACSSSSSSTPSTSDAAVDGSAQVGEDAGGDAGAGASTANTGATCTAPADCTGGDVCCGTIPITGGTVPNCTTGAVTKVCTPPSMCITQLGSSCMGTQTVRICTSNADCTEKGASSCCTFSGDDGGTLNFCASGVVAAFAGGKCMQ